MYQQGHPVPEVSLKDDSDTGIHQICHMAMGLDVDAQVEFFTNSEVQPVPLVHSVSCLVRFIVIDPPLMEK